jgi:hypothetical protein
MPHVIAIFDDDLTLQTAEKNLELAGLNEDVVRVIDSSTRWTERGTPILPAAGVLQGGTILEPRGMLIPGLSAASLDRFGVNDEEAEFLNNALQDGGALLILEAEEGQLAATEQILRESNAQKVIATH